MTTGRSPEHVPAPTSSIATEDTATPPHGLAAPGQDTPSPSGGALADALVALREARRRSALPARHPRRAGRP